MNEKLLPSEPVFDILNAGSNNRFTVMTSRGPLLVHNCGYQGGVAAFLTFAAVYQMDLEKMASAVYEATPKERISEAAQAYGYAAKGRRTLGLTKEVYVACEVLKSAWRTAHPKTEWLWHAAEGAFRSAALHPGETFRANRLAFRRDGNWLRMRLPSGRYLCYLNPEVDERGGLSYTGINQYTRQWGRIKTYGGKLVENATQAFARDILAHNMPAIEEAGYQIILSVHDELLTETPDEPAFSHEHLAEMMAVVPPWAEGIPLAAAGFETTRYRKG